MSPIKATKVAVLKRPALVISNSLSTKGYRIVAGGPQQSGAKPPRLEFRHQLLMVHGGALPLYEVFGDDLHPAYQMLI